MVDGTACATNNKAMRICNINEQKGGKFDALYNSMWESCNSDSDQVIISKGPGSSCTAPWSPDEAILCHASVEPLIGDLASSFHLGNHRGAKKTRRLSRSTEVLYAPCFMIHNRFYNLLLIILYSP